MNEHEEIKRLLERLLARIDLLGKWFYGGRYGDAVANLIDTKEEKSDAQ